ncbi:pyroglutamyl-peptidase I family protein [Oceanitalea stevensii]|uniref:Pyroglutamyl-peptidase I n=1 Tax=Oceanitalea stevensii TaxID=2763072 RepID=A0ABR8YYY7_9MICO|nr:pyroglutamyl-peptidase I [Oceanitalea stevensii]MBD8061287.1 pyroglutamyl-peptidase I [Oceanitalea stevensii]
MPTVLVTGFGPFSDHADNPSALAVDALAREWSAPDGVTVVTETLPVSFARATERVAALVAEHRPAVVLGVGLAAGRDRISLERVALNLCDARIPDVDGAQPVDVPVLPGEPLARPATLPVKAALAAVRAAGLPAELSLSAGSYVCNAVMYAALAAVPEGVPAGFVHVPAADVVPVADVVTALGLVLDTVLADPVDVVVPGGRED